MMLDSSQVDIVVDTLNSQIIPDLSKESIKGYLIETLQNNEFFQGGMVLSILAWVGFQLKHWPLAFWSWIRKFLIYETLIDQQMDGQLYEEFNNWYRNKYPENYRRVQMYMPGKYDEVLNRTKYHLEKYQEEDINFIVKSWRILFVRKHRIRLENANNISNLFYNEYRISGFFARKAIDKMLIGIKNEVNARTLTETGIKIYNLSKSAYEKIETTQVTCYKQFKDLFFDRKQELIEYVKIHNSKRDHCRSKGIKHKTGIRLYGPPGTGKTSIIMALAHEFSMNVAPINLSNFSTDSEFVNYIKEIPSNTIIAFEDIDDYLGNSKSRGGGANDKTFVSFSTVLQVMDGMNSPENVIFVLTTNKPETLDGALYRDGRINLDLQVDLPSWDLIIEYVKHFFDGVGMPNRIPSLSVVPKLSMAKIEQVCINSNTFNESIRKIYKSITEKHEKV